MLTFYPCLIKTHIVSQKHVFKWVLKGFFDILRPLNMNIIQTL